MPEKKKIVFRFLATVEILTTMNNSNELRSEPFRKQNILKVKIQLKKVEILEIVTFLQKRDKNITPLLLYPHISTFYDIFFISYCAWGCPHHLILLSMEKFYSGF